MEFCALSGLLSSYDVVLALDTETTGIIPARDRIIELAVTRLENGRVTGEMDRLIRLEPGQRLPSKIVEITHITDRMLAEEGVEPETACREFLELLEGERVLLIAYNAHFDLSFLFYFLNRFGQAHRLKGIKMLDALTVYRDRRPYPHRLENAIEAYGLTDVQNSHRAIDDTAAMLALLEAMAAEEDDLERYINLFGYNPRYGVSGKKIGSVTYRPQPYDCPCKLYEDDDVLCTGLL